MLNSGEGSELVNYKRAYFGCCAVAAGGLVAGAAAGPDAGSAAPGAEAGLTLDPSGTVLGRLSTTGTPSPRPLAIFTDIPSVPAISMGVSLIRLPASSTAAKFLRSRTTSAAAGTS